jgi:hypothetical protein
VASNGSLDARSISMTENRNRETPAAADMNEDEVETEIDETLEDTFPASDPPSWTLGTDHQVETQSDAEDNGE